MPERSTPHIEFAHPHLPVPLVITQGLWVDGFNAKAESLDGTAPFVWEGAKPLAQFLADNPWVVRGKRVVELGAGTGLPGLVASAVGASEVVMTDMPEALQLINHNIRLNGFGSARVSAQACRWGDEGDLSALRPPFDVILCSDLVYGHGPELYDQLLRTLIVLLYGEGGGGGAQSDKGEGGKRMEGGEILMTYQVRENLLADAPFFDACDRAFEGGVFKKNEKEKEERQEEEERDPVGEAAEVFAHDDEDLWLFRFRKKPEGIDWEKIKASTEGERL
uniref:Uncharacterized protein n=1 Tax=Chromera velia CCMP2878 TaxID=1169474 RepID=A0A0G4GS36_9ALVE|eukprot:Cvel_5129.t1-p1 / transcript=Cvel_5129.t1 / gene=Cvel_5129 / organism=Chromera_velia_CCMP2878 / gene_product=Protein-lysine methyltransferase METTL21A, putative / transcript_product=Protein-lysine methyltransferase METTL21A, putative / location=Cvel_scaffold234:105195-106492(+) / protein_length=277 / sequence_SO=supercontig / SO=protein_coding / is_pseudo=false